MNRDQLLNRINPMLKPVYDDRLAGVALYDSEARGEANVDSDIDF